MTHLNYFSEHEFVADYTTAEGELVEKEWYEDMSTGLLVRMDVMRQQLGKAIRPTRAPDSIGRYNNSTSQHNMKRWGEVRAIDCYVDGVIDALDVERVVLAATDVGMGGIGFYTNWQYPGFHFDVRSDRKPGYPAVWGAITVIDDLGRKRRQYVSIEEAIATL